MRPLRSFARIGAALSLCARSLEHFHQKLLSRHLAANNVGMKRFIKTWLLETNDGQTVLQDGNGNYTLDNSPPNHVAEFREGEDPDDDKEKWRKKVSGLFECRCVRGPDWTEDQIYG